MLYTENKVIHGLKSLYCDLHISYLRRSKRIKNKTKQRTDVSHIAEWPILPTEVNIIDMQANMVQMLRQV